jgi:imidazolonepropionase-like amidohydrolase
MAVVDGVDAARAKTRELIRAGADVIKIASSGGVFSPRSNPMHAQFRDDEIAEIVKEARAAGISVMSHAYATDGIKSAVRNGVRSIEHGTFLDDEAIAMMLERGTWLVPTLMQFSDAKQTGDTQYPDHVRQKEAQLQTGHFDSVRRAIAAGVRVAFGTDTGVTPHGRNLDELPLLAECGMTPAQALHAATGAAAELMGLEAELGTLEPGKRADLVVVDGDPLDLADLAGRVVRVVQDGRTVHTA